MRKKIPKNSQDCFLGFIYIALWWKYTIYVLRKQLVNLGFKGVEWSWKEPTVFRG